MFLNFILKMDGGFKPKRDLNPGQNAILLSKITFFFAFPIFRRSAHKDFKDEDVYESIKEFNSKSLGEKLETEWTLEKKKKHPSFIRAIFNVFKVEYLFWGVLSLIVEISMIVAKPTLIGKIVAYFNPKQTTISKDQVMMYTALLIGCTFANTIFGHTYQFMMKLLALRIKIACSTVIYKKILRLNTFQITDATSGQAVTLITKDIAVFDQIMRFHQLVNGWIQILIMTVMIYLRIGDSAFVGSGLIILFIVVQAYFGGKTMRYRLATAQKTDERIQLTQEMLSAIKVIKMYTLESFFSKLIDNFRRKEIRNFQILTYVRTFCMALGLLSGKLGLYACVVTFVALENHITAEKAFFLTGLFKQVNNALQIYIPMGFVKLAELKATLRRIEHYLLLDEMTQSKAIKEGKKNKTEIVLKNVVLCGGTQPTFKPINIILQPGITQILGSIGSGKSTFLKAILGDVVSSGSIEVSGTISYASQDPWLFPGTIRQNIIFNEAFDKSRYETVIKVCALQKDLEAFSSGDQTLLADKGLNLSQGQRIRINLARAVYKRADIYLLDDCLSAVDLKVGRQIFLDCIKGLLKNKVCVFVCHLHNFLSEVDQIMIICRDGVEFQGTYAQLQEKGGNGITETYKAPEKIKEDETVENEVVDESSALINDKTIETKNIYHEDKEQESVKRDVYFKYISAGGVKLFVVVIILYIVKQVVDTWSDYFIRFWVDSEQNLSNIDLKHSKNSTEYQAALDSHNSIIARYSAVIAAAVALLFITTFAFYVFAGRASVNIHRQLVDKILSAGVTFFDRNLCGNIINRFSRDFNIIDEQLPLPISQCIRVVLSMVGILFVVSSINPWFLIPSALFAVVLYIGRRLYVPAGRNIRRIEGSTRSPVIGHMHATFDGLTTIKASGAQTKVQDEFENHQDIYNSTQYMHVATVEAFSFYLDMLTGVYIGVIIFSLPFFQENIGAGNAGLAITQALALTGLLQWGVLQWSELEVQMTSAERVLEYLKIDSENKSGNTVDNWPRKGKIECKNVSLRYSQRSELVLKNVDFIIEAGEKVGIVGRTGAGKSSIISALFRLYDFEGAVIIDDVDTNTLEVEALRSKISIMPQNPILFAGTIRSNLDPKSLYTDKQIWSALDVVEMKNTITNLDFKIQPNSSDFSIGQKQLLCLARVILQNNLILVFDEATANVDDKTDFLINNSIKRAFASNTVIIIAHRLHTIMDCDKILVMDDGTAVEFDSPKNLLNKENGMFYRMVKEAGLL